MQGSLPKISPREIRYYRNDYSLNCSYCLTGAGIKKCSQCKAIFYCSSECQKADWPRHKPGCSIKEDNLDVKVFFANLFANPLLRRYLEVLVILKLDLVNKPDFNEPFNLQILIDFEPTDIVDFFKLFQPTAIIDSRPMQGMLQISNAVQNLKLKNTDLDRRPTDELQRRQRVLEVVYQEQLPAGFIEFFNQTGKRVSSICATVNIHKESLEIARQAKDLDIPIMFGGETARKKLSPESCVEFINALIRQDTKNQWLLRMNMEKIHKEMIKDAASARIFPIPEQDANAPSEPKGTAATRDTFFMRSTKAKVFGQTIYKVAASHLGIVLSP